MAINIISLAGIIVSLKFSVWDKLAFMYFYVCHQLFVVKSSHDFNVFYKKILLLTHSNKFSK